MGRFSRGGDDDFFLRRPVRSTRGLDIDYATSWKHYCAAALADGPDARRRDHE